MKYSKSVKFHTPSEISKLEKELIHEKKALKIQQMKLFFKKRGIKDESFPEILINNNIPNIIGLHAIHLGLEGNEITSVGLDKLLEKNLDQLSNLTTISLNLSLNRINNSGFKNLFKKFIHNNSNTLKKLKLLLAGSEIGDSGLQEFTEFIKPLKNLKKLVLNLDFNKITEVGANSIGQGISCVALESFTLSLKETNINDMGLSALSDSLGKMVQLKSLLLWINYNNLGNQGVVNLCNNGLKKMRNLENLSLFLAVNSVGDEAINTLNEEIVTGLPSLKGLVLDLERNDISVETCKKLFDAVSTKKDLKKLRIWLDKNNMNDSVTSALAESQIQAKLFSFTLGLCNNFLTQLSIDHLLGNFLMRFDKLISLDINLNDSSIEIDNRMLNLLYRLFKKLPFLTNYNIDFSRNKMRRKTFWFNTLIHELANKRKSKVLSGYQLMRGLNKSIKRHMIIEEILGNMV